MKYFDFTEVSKEKTFVLACSFGPDSMALFKMMLDAGLNFVVAHVNYRKRKESDFEEQSLREYCKKHNKVIEVLDLKDHKYTKNFQAEARELRYKFFAEVAKKYNAEVVFTAHQLDDHLETYFMQKDRGYVSYYGIKPFSEIFGVKVMRPLLDHTKKDLEEFDIRNNVPFSIDVSNLSDNYTRNKIRHSIIDKLSYEDKQKYIDLICELNKKNNSIRLKVNKFIKDNKISLSDALKLDDKEMFFALSELVTLSTGFSYPLSARFINDFRKVLHSKKPNITIHINDKFILCIEYGEIFVTKVPYSYEYEIKESCELKTEEFEINLIGDTSDRNISKDDYPLIIRNSNTKDKYQIKDYEVTLKRLYIDWKMPKHLRPMWPVVINKDGKIIYIPRYRKEFIDNHKTKFLIKLK